MVKMTIQSRRNNSMGFNLFKKDNPKKWNDEGNKFLKEGNYSKAIECYEKAVKIDPNYKIALNNIGLALIYLSKYNESLEFFDKTLEIDSKDIYALMGKGLALSDLHKYKEALEYYEMALKIDPKNVNALDAKNMLLKLIKNE
jgi:tetratricopeptide (TPR) repeat protein